jgi:hypothetical protein
VYRIRVVTDRDECRDHWERVVPREFISDLWEVRECFDRHYRHEPRFIVAEEHGEIRGLLPLSFNRDSGLYNFFPGETWAGKTWLEQNRIVSESHRMLRDMLSAVPGPYHLRYLRPEMQTSNPYEQVDETGYLFCPPKYACNMDRYFDEFSHKTAKKLRRELSAWEDRDLTWRFDEPRDFDLLVAMSIGRYGQSSYFHDPRFLDSFRQLRDFLAERSWLRIVTIQVGGIPAATDLGSVYNGTLTMLAGGTHSDYPGIAKLINIHHMTWACEQKLDRVDFLCGDFNWKTMFHLSPVPLYLLERDSAPIHTEVALSTSRQQWAAHGLDVGGVASA